jgi:hypothetical protein
VTVDEQQRADLPEPADPSDLSAEAGGPSDAVGQAETSEPAFDAGGDPLPARTFAPGLDDEALGFTSAVRQPAGCSWCGGPIPEHDAATCPSCGAALHQIAGLPDIPGVTVPPADVRHTVRDVSPEILALVAPAVGDQIALPGSRPELGPPDASVRRAMLQLELEAQRAALAAAGEAAAGAETAEGLSTDVDVPGAEPGD